MDAMKQKKKKYVLHRLITCLLMLAIFVFGSGEILDIHVTSYRNEARDALVGTLTAESYRVSSLNRLNERYRETMRHSGEFFIHFACESVEKLDDITPDTLKATIDRFGTAADFFYSDASGHVTGSTGSPEYPLTGEQTETLHRQGYLFGEDVFYSCAPCGNGWLVILWNNTDTMNTSIAVETDSYNGEKFMWINRDGIVTVSSDNEMNGQNFGEDFQEILSNCGSSEIHIAKDYSYVYLARDMGEEGVLLAYIPLVTMVVTGILRRTMVPILLLFVACITMLRYATSLYVEHRNNPEQRSEKKLTGSLCVDRIIVSHLAALVIFCMLLLGCSTWYIQSLTAQSDFNISSRSDFSHVVQALEENSISRENAFSVMDEKYYSVAGVIAQNLKDDPQTLSAEKLKEIAAMLPEIKDISVFDQDGKLEASNKHTAGYYLSRNEENAEYQCWQLITGGVTRLIIRNDSMPDSEYVCIRRKDAPGLLRLTIDRQSVNAMIADMSIENALTATNTGKTNIMMVEAGNTGLIYIAEHDSQTVQKKENPIPVDKLVDGYSGFLYVDRELQYITVMAYGDLFFINMARSYDVLGNTILWSVLIEELVCISVFLLILLMTCLFRNKNKTLHENEETGIFRQVFTNNRKVDRRFARCLQGMLACTALLLLILLLLDAKVSKQSLLAFLTGTNWMHGVNMFSGTVILFIFTIGQLISLVLGRLILLISGNLGPKGKTIGRMMVSLMRFALLIAAIVMSLFEIGVNITMVLTGAGIIGAALSLCAQSTVSDLLAGFFIIFEDRIHVGDWITVEDWRGQVKEIGMRTTTVSKGGDVRIVSNSKLNGSTVLNPKLHGAIVEVSVSYDEDIDAVFKLITDNRALYRKEIPDMDDGPYIYGVTGLGEDGVEFKILAYADEPKIAHLEREIRRVTKKLFDEHGVEIPWRQVVVHQGRSLTEQSGKPTEK